MSGGDRKIALGWSARARGKPSRARQYFLAGLEAGGDPREGQAGLALIARDRVPDGLEGPARAVAQARVLGFQYDWEGVAQIEDELASIPPGDALFIEAGRLRARWRIATGKHAEAVPILDVLLIDAGPKGTKEAIRKLRRQAAAGGKKEKMTRDPS